MFTAKKAVLTVSVLTFISGQSYAEEPEEMSDVEVIGITPVLGVGPPEETMFSLPLRRTLKKAQVLTLPTL